MPGLEFFGMEEEESGLGDVGPEQGDYVVALGGGEI